MQIRPLAVADIPAAQRLREQAGWNQTDHDWRRLLAWSPDGCWAAELDGQVVGTTAVTTYGRRIAWIGMVLVDEAYRRRGIGRALLTHAIEHLDRLGLRTIALDSTPEGRPLYASLGFTDLFDLARWRGPIPRPAVGDPVIRPLAPADLPAVVAYDARLFGTGRAHILDALYADHPRRCFVAERRGQLAGYVLSRPGARAWHLGPLAADDPRTAERLSRTALLLNAGSTSWAATAPGADSAVPGSPSPGAGRAAGGSTSPDAGRASRGAPSPDDPPYDLVMDVVMPNADAVALAGTLGLTQVRRFIRMTRGAPPPVADVDRLYTSAGPELG